MIRLFVTVSDVSAVMAAGYTVIRVYTDVSETGTFTTLDGTITLVAATVSYEYTDLDGTSATWYKTCYWGAVPGEGAKSDARRGETRAAYATVKELRAEMNLDATTDDLTLARLLDAAATNIDRACGVYRPGFQYFIAAVTATARAFPGSGLQYQRIDPCVEITLVAVKDSVTDTTYTSWTPTDWMAYSGSHTFPNFNDLPYTAIMIEPGGDYAVFTSGGYGTRASYFPPQGDGLTPYRQGGRMTPTVQVTARWGYSDTVPPDILEANIMQAARWYKVLQGGMTDSIGSPDLGTLMYTKALHPDVARILHDGGYKKLALGVK